MKRYIVIAIIIAMLLSSCQKADIVIRTDLENTRPSMATSETEVSVMTAATGDDGLMIFIVNSSSKTFHISEECRHVKNMSDKNKRLISAENEYEMAQNGYKPCATCIDKNKTEQTEVEK